MRMQLDWDATTVRWNFRTSDGMHLEEDAYSLDFEGILQQERRISEEATSSTSSLGALSEL